MEQPPQCIGIILDGNRRWAKAKGLPGLQGHRTGLSKITDCAHWVREAGIKHLVVYALSTENLHRTEEEVSYFMELAIEAAETKIAELGKENVRVKFIGNLALVPSKVREAVEKVERETAQNSGLTLWICFAYGGRAEIVAAAAKAAAAGENITEESLPKYFWSAGMPDPDLVIRPGGEKRLSNFLLWEAAYSELFFVDTMWPDFSKEKLDEVLAEFSQRQRRMGK